MTDRRFSCDAGHHPIEHITGDHCANCGCSGPEVARCKPAPQSDLISQLADSIIALINSKPQSPRKEEIEHMLIACPALKNAYRVECNKALKAVGLNVPEDALEEAEVTIVDPELGRIGKDIVASVEEKQAVEDSLDRIWYQFDLGLNPCKVTTSGAHDWTSHPAPIAGYRIYKCRCGAEKT